MAEKRFRSFLCAALALILALALCGCGAKPSSGGAKPGSQTASKDGSQSAAKTGELYILCTSDTHCSYDEGFGLEGLQQIRDRLEAKGCETLLVDDGDAIQGGPAGTMSEGEDIIGLMNAAHYDVAIPGNHEFDYGADRFVELTKQADFPYISCNLTRDGKRVFDPYVIKEAAGLRIAFVGVTTPESLTSSNPVHFQNKDGEQVYGFMEDESGEKVCSALQDAADQARDEGADLVVAMGHLGTAPDSKPWTVADVISRTNGIDVFFDGHSHDSEVLTINNKDGDPVTRFGCGEKLSAIGYCHISAEGEIREADVWSWTNETSMSELLGLDNAMSAPVQAVNDKVEKLMREKVAATSVALMITDPEEKDAEGHPVQMVRRAETNFGDLVADAFRAQAGSDISLVVGGGVRADIDEGDISRAQLLEVTPFGNDICVIEASGQQILDALEWGSQAVPEEFGGFLQVSGLTYEIDTSIPTSCTDDVNGLAEAISGKRRVRNVKVGDQPIDPEGRYTVAGTDFTLVQNGDGYTAFDGAKVVTPSIGIDVEVLADYINEKLGGSVGEDYADPRGQGRITVK